MADLRMPEINCVTIVGNLTKDPIYRTTSNDSPVVNFSIATNRKYRDSANKLQEDVCYIGVVAWNKLAESCKNKLKKGCAVLVDGELQSRNWKSEDGHNKSVVEIKARRIQFLNKHLKGSNHSNGGADEHEIFVDETVDYTEDSFDKFLSPEESNLINNDINRQGI
ncbi:MAG: single-stranded DNA-binding protein [Ignavibacteria bacterium CG22_combo_CG10-13_8_21_14_all_37_15]|nr:single-stranded DNA-binding protein [Ignavibacteria bacterium]PIP76616.1 MAG: single-stranded DNA-binding protein [Ignavibacteria bacterium CG22_combo_CG10-13_8_21_14_all_37_15]PIS43942.1 MAG: single-stranded DNA-binding protein [Ignavibacteria bacterium CG08_land_8_20_14_0_20_37_9]PIX93636.1 MAG: single-stranded DNA-binding protein [Ignavibacteria bacterium CG_4_10_14_3_um_filter_37_18]PJC60811.1 MAG: single-stranded DNA-binding protein [Ignavibacteria bacterium CG_4_9_14_0_2_um_filter_37_1